MPEAYVIETDDGPAGLVSAEKESLSFFAAQPAPNQPDATHPDKERNP